MTWDLTKVTRNPHANPALVRLMMSVTMEFTNYDANGVAIETHVYTEPNVSDFSTAGVGKLVRDQIRQLEIRSATATGVAGDLAGIRALIRGPRLSADLAAAVAPHVDFSQTDQAIADALNASTVANPVATAPMITPPIDIGQLIGALSAEAQANLATNPNTPTLREDARQRDGAALIEWAGLFVQKGLITPDEYMIVRAACSPVPDPAWTPTVARAALVFGRAVTVDDVAVIRALAG